MPAIRTHDKENPQERQLDGDLAAAAATTGRPPRVSERRETYKKGARVTAKGRVYYVNTFFLPRREPGVPVPPPPPRQTREEWEAAVARVKKEREERRAHKEAWLASIQPESREGLRDHEWPVGTISVDINNIHRSFGLVPEEVATLPSEGRVYRYTDVRDLSAKKFHAGMFAGTRGIRFVLWTKNRLDVYAEKPGWAGRHEFNGRPFFRAWKKVEEHGMTGWDFLGDVYQDEIDKTEAELKRDLKAKERETKKLQEAERKAAKKREAQERAAQRKIATKKANKAGRKNITAA
ncbi:hypothetical protein HDZ31DRAFT_72359 [Schizophyllum fasciatum]